MLLREAARREEARVREEADARVREQLELHDTISPIPSNPNSIEPEPSTDDEPNPVTRLTDAHLLSNSLRGTRVRVIGADLDSGRKVGSEGKILRKNKDKTLRIIWDDLVGVSAPRRESVPLEEAKDKLEVITPNSPTESEIPQPAQIPTNPSQETE